MAIEWNCDVAIYSDCRSLVQWLHAFTYRKTIYIPPRLLALSEALQTITHKICVCWIPGHWGIDGNERADTIAKSFLQSNVAVDTISKRQNQVSIYKKRLQERLDKRPRPRSHRPQGHLESSDRPELIYSSTSRYRQQVALWLRSGHSPLNKHLFRVNKRPNPDCPHCPGIQEGRRHFLLECPEHQLQRHTFILPCLSSASLLPSHPEAVDFLLHHTNISKVVTYTIASKRFRMPET